MSMEERRAKMIARLEARNPAKSEPGDCSAGSAGRDPQLLAFLSAFGAHRDAATAVIGAHNDGSRPLETCMAQLADEVEAMAKLVSENETGLPAYDARKALQQLEEVRSSYVAMQREYRPKKGFAFKARPSGPEKPTVDMDKQQKAADAARSLVAELCAQSAAADLANVAGGEHVLSTVATDRRDVTLADLTDCTVFVAGCPATLHVTRCIRCVVVAAPTRTSVFVEDCVGCTLVVACQQLRAHTSTDCTLALHVTGAAIMENCTQITVQPYLLTEAAGLDFKSLLTNAGIDPSHENKWATVQDFNWLAADRPSPNWTPLAQDRWRRWTLKRR